ncbi:MAG: gliding motility-associated C-terminal domain-containing protein, partial [Bacteroidales bacterium]|nr:gliding motility-associated C-terminal domain-containing protein [Bacteroidales bacterium]
FRIEIDHASGCTSRSNITYDVLGDSYAPPMPRLDSVSIDLATGNVIMGWTPSTATDAEKYYIYHDENNINDIYDTVFGRLNTFYADDLFDPCSKNRGWAISAEDSCGNIGPGTYDIPQRTILLDPVDFNPCTMVNRLSWSQYINMVPELQGYYVYLSADGSPFELQATVFDSITFYEHQGLDPDRNYRYFIRAFSTGSQVTSTSCIQELNTWQYRRPVENKMENASVENSDYVNLAFLPDTFAYVPYLRVYRSEDNNGPWAMVGEVEINGLSEVYYDDETADVNSSSYYYYSTIIDSCGNEVLESDPFRTIFLSGEQGDLQNMLEWNAFEGWPGGILGYEVFRAVGGEGFISLDEPGGNMLSYTDDISVLPGDFSVVRYLVRALSDGTDTLVSWSNEIYFEYHPQMYLPNAFRPGGLNSVFRPVGNFVNFSDYRLEIYNRWGEMIFSTDDFGTGWDGTIGGTDAPAGMYVCKLNYRSSTGRTETLKTSLVLLR